MCQTLGVIFTISNYTPDDTTRLGGGRGGGGAVEGGGGGGARGGGKEGGVGELTANGRHSASKLQRRKLQDTMKRRRKRKRRARETHCHWEEGELCGGEGSGHTTDKK